MDVVSLTDDVYDAGNTVEALSDSSKIVDDFVDWNKNIPNPYGRKGGIAHQTEIKNQISKYPNAQIGTEVKIYISGGYKPYRFADFSVTENGYTWYGNVGKQNKNGLPIARELRALEDMRRMGFDVRFFPYN